MAAHESIAHEWPGAASLPERSKPAPGLPPAALETNPPSRLVAWISALSLLEPLVALAWQAAFARAAGATLSAAHHLLLFASLWLVYIADHWLDARGTPYPDLRTSRHRFAAEHRRGLLGAWVLVLLSSLTLASRSLDAQEWLCGLCLIASTLMYLTLIHRVHRWLRFAKELWVAALFAAGSSLFIWSNQPLALDLLVAIGLFSLLALLNLTVIAEREQHVDQAQGTTSIAHDVKSVGRLNAALAAAVVLGSGLAFAHFRQHWELFGSLVGCALALTAQRRWGKHQSHELAHVTSDGILLLPAGCVLLQLLR